MIPLKLNLRNFMPYRENVPPLHFEGLHTACICGDNGNGKSALVDAMTWALWGKTRAKSDDDLIHQGQAEMEVEFEFAVGKQAYRIIRKHAKPKKSSQSGQSSLDLFIASDGSFKAISAESKNQTQQKIVDILHMDYDTFVNSAFLRQGHADEFTTANPAKRKQVLANILGLTEYDELEERAKGLEKEREQQRQQCESAIQDLDSELAQKPVYEVELSRAQAEMSRIDGEIKEQDFKLKELRHAKEKLESQRQQLDQLQQHIRDDEKSLARWKQQSEQHQARLKDCENLAARRSEIESNYAQLAAAKKLNSELDRKFRDVSRLNESKHNLETKFSQAQHELLRAESLAQKTIKDLEERAESLPQLKSELQQIQAQLTQLAPHETTLKEKRQQTQSVRDRIGFLEAQLKQLPTELHELEDKLHLLLHQTTTHCPLCDSEVGVGGLKNIEEKYTQDKNSKSGILDAALTELANSKTELAQLDKEALQLETKLNEERAGLQGRISFINQSAAEAEKANQKLSEERERLTQIQQGIITLTTEQQETLGKLEKELGGIEYDAQQHEEVRSKLSTLEKYEALNQQLAEVDKTIAQERDALAQAGEAMHELVLSLEAEKRLEQGLLLEMASLPEASGRLAQAENEYQTILQQQKAAQGALFSAQAKLKRCEELEARKAEKMKLLAEAAREEQIYQELAQAFGKKGIQALLIEMALPEIEIEANRLLSRMTDNRMNVKFETQKPTKKGEVTETLDIKISDELGTRNYEMFSGGEAFRINFAIRIALSKLLARRAGAPLPTLIIDEGFGTQDNVGVEKIKEAINSIQDDFNKILIITHLEDMKDAFPTRINVVKTAAGSMLEVN